MEQAGRRVERGLQKGRSGSLTGTRTCRHLYLREQPPTAYHLNPVLPDNLRQGNRQKAGP